MRTQVLLAGGIAFLWVLGSALAQPAQWKMGGAGLAWDEHDSLQVLIDFDGVRGALRPVFLQPDDNLLPRLENWQFWRDPTGRTLAYEPGLMPRIWLGSTGSGGDPTRSGLFYIDADSSTYNAPLSVSPTSVFYTLDLAVPVPVGRFGFFTPPEGFRADGTPLRQDATPAFDVSIGDDAEPAVQTPGGGTLSRTVASVAENLEPEIHIDFPRQYVRYVRWRRRESILDATALQRCTDCAGAQGNQAVAIKGSIGGFEVFAEGIPARALYLSRVIDLGGEVNFGRLHWSATPMRLRDGAAVLDEEAEVGLKVEVRAGRDGDPVVYHEFTNTGREGVVSRARYEELKTAAGRAPKPGVRASVDYDRENWTFWSVPFERPGQDLGLRSGSHLQVRITLESADYDAWVRLDSLWVETSPLVATRVVGEVARRDDPRPRLGFAEVVLGEVHEFVYDIAAFFDGPGRSGFDALRIRTAGESRLVGLETGDPLVPTEPAAVFQEGGDLVIYLAETVDAADNRPVRVVFSTELFGYATTFSGEVFARGSGFGQPVVAGDAGLGLSTNSLRVLGVRAGASALLRDLALSTPVLTPNGDGANDLLEVSYALFRLPEPVAVELLVHGLDGRLLYSRSLGPQGAGRHSVDWDGRDSGGRLVSPGIYALSVYLESEASAPRLTRAVGVSY